MVLNPRLVDVVVTGASGFIGRALGAHWRRQGVAWRGLARTADAGWPEWIALGDLATADEGTLRAQFSGARAVVHLAGRAHILREDAVDPTAAYRAANLIATERVARAAAAAGVMQLVFASTVKVHGETTQPGQVWSEDDALAPVGDYAVSKRAAEAALAGIADETGLAVTMLRLPLVYGVGVKGNFLALVDAVARGRWLPLAGIHNRRSLLALPNLVAAIDAVLARPGPVGIATPYLLADRECPSTPELARAIGNAMGRHARLMPVPAAALRAAGAVLGKADAVARLTGSLVVDSSRFRATYDWSPACTLAQGLAAMLQPDPPL